MAYSTLTQANPVANTLYTCLATAGNIRVKEITANVTWTVQPNPIDIVVTVDGNACMWSFTNPVSTTAYFATTINLALALNAQGASTTPSMATKPFIFEGRSVLVQMRTGRITAGTTSELSGRVLYEQLK